MADYFTPTVIQPAIAIADITPLERLLLSHVFNAERQGERLYFYADEGPADRIWLDRARLEAALAQSASTAPRLPSSSSTSRAFLPTMSRSSSISATGCWEAIFQDIVRRSPSLRYVTAVSAFTCSKMRPDGFGGMAVLITADTVMGKSTSDIVADFLNTAVPDRADEPPKPCGQ